MPSTLVQPGFGISIMVLNGLVANLGMDITNEKVDTLGMQPF